jgi:hypothetical protein
MKASYECNVCYEHTTKIIHCFGQCNFKVCRQCFKKMIVLKNSEVTYDCPMCRCNNTYITSRRFTKFINNHIDLLRMVVELTYVQFRTNVMWDNFVVQQYPMFQAYMIEEFNEDPRGMVILSP